MNNFEIVLIIGVSLTILLFILLISLLIRYIYLKSNEKKLSKARPRNRKKVKRWKLNLKQLEDKKAKVLRNMLFSLLAVFIIGGGTGYAKYYQSTTISEQDIDNIVYGYYLVEQITEQLNEIDSLEEKKASENIHTLGIALSSYSSKKGSDRSTEEAQILLNKYYARIGQFGLNISSQNFLDLKENEAMQKDYLEDLKKISEIQNKVITYYKIDESSLKSKK